MKKIWCCFIITIIPLSHLLIVYSKRNWENGFHNEKLSKGYDMRLFDDVEGKEISSECALKSYYLPTYDLLIYLFWPLHKMYT